MCSCLFRTTLYELTTEGTSISVSRHRNQAVSCLSLAFTVPSGAVQAVGGENASTVTPSCGLWVLIAYTETVRQDGPTGATVVQPSGSNQPVQTGLKSYSIAKNSCQVL